MKIRGKLSIRRGDEESADGTQNCNELLQTDCRWTELTDFVSFCVSNRQLIDKLVAYDTIILPGYRSKSYHRIHTHIIKQSKEKLTDYQYYIHSVCVFLHKWNYRKSQRTVL